MASVVHDVEDNLHTLAAEGKGMAQDRTSLDVALVVAAVVALEVVVVAVEALQVVVVAVIHSELCLFLESAQLAVRCSCCSYLLLAYVAAVPY